MINRINLEMTQFSMCISTISERGYVPFADSSACSTLHRKRGRSGKIGEIFGMIPMPIARRV